MKSAGDEYERLGVEDLDDGAKRKDLVDQELMRGWGAPAEAELRLPWPKEWLSLDGGDLAEANTSN
jgi:hypothetical protein